MDWRVEVSPARGARPPYAGIKSDVALEVFEQLRLSLVMGAHLEEVRLERGGVIVARTWPAAVRRCPPQA